MKVPSFRMGVRWSEDTISRWRHAKVCLRDLPLIMVLVASSCSANSHAHPRDLPQAPLTLGNATANGLHVQESDSVKPARPGIYRYDIVDPSNPSRPELGASLFVRPATGVRQETVETVGDSSTTVVAEYREDGIYLLAVTFKGAAFVHDISFTTSDPFRVIPREPKPGLTTSGDATSDDGCYRMQADGSIDSLDDPVTIGNKTRLHGVRIHSERSLTPTGKADCVVGIIASSDVTTWFSPEVGLILKQEAHTVFKHIPAENDAASQTVTVSGNESLLLLSEKPE